MKKCNRGAKNKCRFFLLAVALLAGVIGTTTDSAFAETKKLFEANADIRIEIRKIIGLTGNRRAFGKIWLSSVEENGTTVDGVGTVIFTKVSEGQGHSFVLSASVIINDPKKGIIRRLLVGEILDGDFAPIENDIWNGSGVIKGRLYASENDMLDLEGESNV